jgi:hypothetical protein
MGFCLECKGNAHESPEAQGHAGDHLHDRFFFYVIEKIQVQRQDSPHRDGPISELERFFKSGSN